MQRGYIIVMCVGILCCQSALRGADLKRDLVASYEAPAAQVRKAYENVSYKYREGQFTKDGVEVVANHIECRCAFGKIFTSVATISRSKGRVLPGTDQYYYFWNHCYMASVVDRNNKKLVERVDALPDFPISYTPYNGAYSHPAIGGRTYIEFLRHPNTEVIAVEDVQWQNRKVRRVICEFGVSYQKSKSKQASLKRVGLCFLPEQSWVCCGVLQYDSKKPHEPPYKEDFLEYANEGSVVPVLKSIYVFRTSETDGKRYREIGGKIYDFKRHEEPFPDSVFTLSHLGLPEPEGMTTPDPRLSENTVENTKLFPSAPDPNGSRSHWWWIGGSLIAILFVVAYRYRRRASTT